MIYTNIDRVLIISIGFLLLFIAFNSAANLSASAMKTDNLGELGFYSMAVLYLVFAFASFFSSAIVGKLGTKWSLIVGGLCYFFWVFCFILPAFYSENMGSDLKIFSESFIYFLILLASGINGFGAGILWTAEG